MAPCPPRPGLTPFGSRARVALGEAPFLGCGKLDACDTVFVSGRNGPATVRTDNVRCRFCGAVYREPEMALGLANDSYQPSLFDMLTGPTQ